MADELVPTTLHKGFHIPMWADQYMKEYQDFEVREDDVFVDCFPKCGASWLQQVVYLVVRGLDYEDPHGPTVEERIPFMEYMYPGLDDIKARTGRRLIKSHLAYRLLPPPIHNGKGKVLVLARNPKDVLVSFYHFVRMNKVIDFKGDFNELYKHFQQDKIFYGPYLKYVEEFWQHKDDDNVLFLFYEDMKKDLSGNIRQIAKFLDRDLTDEEIEMIAEKCEFKNMQSDKTCNYSWWDEKGLRNQDGTHFMRKGEVGDWKNLLTPEMSEEIDEMFKPLEKKGLRFTYE